MHSSLPAGVAVVRSLSESITNRHILEDIRAVLQSHVSGCVLGRVWFALIDR